MVAPEAFDGDGDLQAVQVGLVGWWVGGLAGRWEAGEHASQACGQSDVTGHLLAVLLPVDCLCGQHCRQARQPEPTCTMSVCLEGSSK